MKPAPTRTLGTTSTTFMTPPGRKASTHWKVGETSQQILFIYLFPLRSWFITRVQPADIIYIKNLHLCTCCLIYFTYSAATNVFFICFSSERHNHTNECMRDGSHTYTLTLYPPPPPPPPSSLCWVSADIFMWDMYIADIYMAVRFGSTWGQRSVGKRFPDAH